jgi:hypothetical protein
MSLAAPITGLAIATNVMQILLMSVDAAIIIELKNLAKNVGASRSVITIIAITQIIVGFISALT